MKHKLKTLPAYFEAIMTGDKQFEIRDNTDRGFQKGDIVILKEYDPTSILGHKKYSGRAIPVEITYVTNYQQQPGYVVFGFKPIKMAFTEDDIYEN